MDNIKAASSPANASSKDALNSAGSDTTDSSISQEKNSVKTEFQKAENTFAAFHGGAAGGRNGQRGIRLFRAKNAVEKFFSFCY